MEEGDGDGAVWRKKSLGGMKSLKIRTELGRQGQLESDKRRKK